MNNYQIRDYRYHTVPYSTLRRTLLSKAAPYWATPHPTDLRRALLSYWYAASLLSYWYAASLLSHTAPYRASPHPLFTSKQLWRCRKFARNLLYYVIYLFNAIFAKKFNFSTISEFLRNDGGNFSRNFQRSCMCTWDFFFTKNPRMHFCS